MTNNPSDYEDIDDTLSKTTESIYLNPVFDDHDEALTKLPLLNNSTDNEQSPFEEVAANVSNKDDSTMSCLTLRSVFIGILLTCVMSFTFQFFAYRTSPMDFNIGIVILLSYMIGKFVSKVLPEKLFNITLNPGPFTVKEHALITIMATSASSTVFAMEPITVQRLYYKYYLSHFNAILFIIIMHLLAFSIAGIFNRYLVWPASMIWPKTLMSCGLIRTLDVEGETTQIKTRWSMTRSTFFWLIVFLQFVWYWLPGYIFPLLSFFSFVCMIAPQNIVLSQLTGANGLGLGALEFDWNAWVAYLDSPILVPFWAHVNMFLGFIIVIWIGTPIIYYSNVWESKKMPIISNRVFDTDGYFYNVRHVLDKNLRLNETAYQSYGEMRMTTGYVVSYGFIFAAIAALIVHAVLYHGKSFVEQFRSNLSDKKNDIHAKLMSHYPQVSEWWYYLLLFFTFVIGLIHCHITELMPGYILLFAIFLNLIFILPIGIVTAMTSMIMTTSTTSDLITGLILPGNPIGYLGFRTYSYTCQTQIIIFLTNFKIAHYMKIPPRITFFVLILCPIIATIVDYITALYLLNNIPNICTSKNLVWKCLSVENSYTLSIIWGAIGSVKAFGSTSMYSPLLYGFAIGAISPIISWSLWKTYPNIKWLALINFPIFFMATNIIPPAPAAEYPSWFIVGFIFNYVLYRHAHNWWEKYAYIFSAAMSCGVVISGLFIFFAFQNNNIKFPEWWGMGGSTGDGCPLDTANYSGFIPSHRQFDV